jgi:excisionase family DNA binding protein
VNEAITKGKTMNETITKPNLLNVADAAWYMNINERQVRRMIELRVLPVIKIGKHVRIAQAEIDVYLKANTREVREL